MAQIFRVVDESRRSVGNDQIHAFFQPDLRPQPPDHAMHLGFGILGRTAIVPAGALKSQQLEPAVTNDSAVQVDAAHDGGIPIADVVVAAHIEKRCIEGSPEELLTDEKLSDLYDIPIPIVKSRREEVATV